MRGCTFPLGYEHQGLFLVGLGWRSWKYLQHVTTCLQDGKNIHFSQDIGPICCDMSRHITCVMSFWAWVGHIFYEHFQPGGVKYDGILKLQVYIIMVIPDPYTYLDFCYNETQWLDLHPYQHTIHLLWEGCTFHYQAWKPETWLNEDYVVQHHEMLGWQCYSTVGISIQHLHYKAYCIIRYNEWVSSTSTYNLDSLGRLCLQNLTWMPG